VRRESKVVKTVEGSTDRDMAWMPDGRTILMSAGTKVFAWTRGSEGWVEVFDAAALSLGTVSRLQSPGEASNPGPDARCIREF
jgi:hypothetical protein